MNWDILKITEKEADLIGGRNKIPSMMKKRTSFAVKGRKAAHTADTTGAGDAFFGSFLSRLLRRGIVYPHDLTRENLEDAIRYGNVAGSLCIQSKGAVAALPYREEIEKNLEEIE